MDANLSQGVVCVGVTQHSRQATHVCRVPSRNLRLKSTRVSVPMPASCELGRLIGRLPQRISAQVPATAFGTPLLKPRGYRPACVT